MSSSSAFAAQHLKLWFLLIAVGSLCGCSSPPKQPPTLGFIDQPYKEVALKVHEHFIDGERRDYKPSRFMPLYSVNAYSGLRQIHFAFDDGLRKATKYESFVSIVGQWEKDAKVRVEIRSVRTDYRPFWNKISRRTDREKKLLEEIIRLFGE